MTKTSRAPRALALIAAALGLFVGVAACGDLTRPKPQLENHTDTLTVSAINGTPVSAPAGLWLFGRIGVPIDAGFNFDLGFDIDAQGAATMYTVRVIAGGLATAHSVGLLRVQEGFDALSEAPKNGFVTDSSFAVTVGDVFAVVTTDPNACGFSLFSNQINAKIEVLAINPGDRTIKSRFTVNPNCGFVSLAPTGIPNR
jgi:hypothetical protein